LHAHAVVAELKKIILRCIFIGRDTNVLTYVKRRLAMCARKLYKLKEAVKAFRDVSTNFFPHRNTIPHFKQILTKLNFLFFFIYKLSLHYMVHVHMGP